jgi:hypothetical protein
MDSGTDKPRYCKPWNAGLASEPRAVGRTLGRLLDAIGEVNENLVEGQVIEDCRALKLCLLENLRADGWRITRRDAPTYRWQVLPPKRGK